MSRAEQRLSVRQPPALLALGLAAGAIALPGGAAGSPAPEQVNPQARASGITDCGPYANFTRYRNHEGEVCTAYIGNSAMGALQPYYKFGNNSVGYLSDPTKHHLETRYWAGPRQAIENRVSTWPETKSLRGNKVSEKVGIISLSASLKADRALLKTRESWKVTSPDGDLLYREPTHNKNVTMCRGRLPGHPLHAWVVVKFARDPKFDCIAFDKQNGLKP